MSNGILLPHEVDQIVKLGEAIGKERLELDMIDQMKIMEQRRYELAKAAMQGLLASDVINEYKTTGMGVEQVTTLAIEHADALLKALEEKE
jgi:hypothetical protein